MSDIPNISWNLPKGRLSVKSQEVLTRYIKSELEKKINKLPENYIDRAYELINYDIQHDNYKLVKDLLFKLED